MTKDVFRFIDTYHLFVVLGEVLVGAVIAFFMELTEYLLVSYTSSLTLSVSGIVKVYRFLVMLFTQRVYAEYLII